MSTVHRLLLSRTPTVGAAIGAYLATLEHPETASTRRVSAVTLHQLRTHLGDDQPVAVLNEADTAQQLVNWFSWRWDSRTLATINRNLDALRSTIRCWGDADISNGPKS